MMKRLTSALVIFAFVAGSGACFAAETRYPGIIQRITKFLGRMSIQERGALVGDTVGGVQGAMVSIADDGVISSRKYQLSPGIKADLQKNPDRIYVVEVLVPAYDMNSERPIDPRSVTPMGMGTDVYDALARSNPIRAGATPGAIDRTRSKFLVAVLIAGELVWSEVPMPQPDVLREKVALAKAKSAQALSVPVASPIQVRNSYPPASPARIDSGSFDLSSEPREARLAPTVTTSSGRTAATPATSGKPAADLREKQLPPSSRFKEITPSQPQPSLIMGGEFRDYTRDDPASTPDPPDFPDVDTEPDIQLPADNPNEDHIPS